MHDVFDARAMIQLADVQTMNDTGQAQTVTVTTGSGAIYSDVEVVQSFGMSGRPPVDGCTALLFAIGGDPANMRAILFNPSFRFGNQAEGEMTMFAPDGTRVSARAGGVIDVKGGNQINVSAPNIVIVASTAVSITAPTLAITCPTVTLEGNLHVGGNIEVDAGSIKVNGVTVIVP